MRSDFFDILLGTGLNNVTDKIFRIGHSGDFNDLMLMGTLIGGGNGHDTGERAPSHGWYAKRVKIFCLTPHSI